MAMKIRALDYYLKDMPYEAKKDVLLGITNINGVMIRQLLEKGKNYPTLRSMGFSDSEIQEYVDASVESFEKVNEAMEKGERYPLFPNPEDTFSSAQEYMNLLQMKEDQELVEEFGCTIEEYEPKVYKKKSDKTVEDDGISL